MIFYNFIGNIIPTEWRKLTIKVENRIIIKDNVKLHNVNCIKLLKNFQHYNKKEKEENITLPEKKFAPT
ncbi:hypothetical protein F0363_00920 [Orientia tsutsugamushi]|nr:hypothetical protein F0363_00920 [Orientia tsutsugamushi]